jgi:hypothetical protein
MTRRAAAWVGVGITILIAASSGVASRGGQSTLVNSDDDPVSQRWRLAFPIDYDDFVLEFRRYLTAAP